jgi:spermidine/putrescine transport system permease protein
MSFVAPQGGTLMTTGERTIQSSNALRGLLLTLPALVWSVLFFALPFGTMLVWSFFERNGPSSGVPGLGNYQRLWEDAALRDDLINSLKMTTAVTLLSVLLAFPLAYAIATQVAQRHQRLCLMLAVLPFWTSYVVRSYAWLLVLAPNGVVNQTLLDVGLIAEPLVLSFNAGATLVGFVHFFVMLCTLTIYSSLVRMDPKLLLAAADLGASHWQAFWRVTLPLAAPGVASGAFLTFVITIGDFVTPQILGGSNDLLLPQIVLLQISRRGDIPMAAALSVVLMLCVTVAYLGLARWLTGRRT